MSVLELTVDYGAEELSALGRLLGAGEAPGLAAPEPAPMSAETRRAVQATAWRGLVARRALLIEPGPPPSFAVAEPHASVLAPLIAPERVVTLARGEAHRAFYLRGETAVEQVPLPGLLYRHTLFARVNAAERLLRAAAIEDRPEASGDPFEIPRTALSGDTHPLLYAALSITDVGEFLWIDGGELGLWRGTGSRTVRLEPVSADALRAALTALL